MNMQDRFREVLSAQEVPLGLCAGCVQESYPDPLPAVMLAPILLTVGQAPAVVVLGVCGDRHKGALAPAGGVQPGTVIPGPIPGIGLNGPPG